MADLGSVDTASWGAVNNAGQVGGGVFPSDQGGWSGYAARWQDGVVTELDNSGTTYAGGSAIDGAARVFGSIIYRRGEAFHASPTLWDAGVRQEIAEPNAGEDTGFTDASENGNAVGVIHATRDSTTTFLARPPDYQPVQIPGDARPFGVNDAGHVVAGNSDGVFLWTGGGANTPIDIAPGGNHALGQNDEVVGRRYLGENTVGGPAVRRGDGTIDDLPAPEGTPPGATRAVAISFGGVIVGSLEHRQDDGTQVRDGVIWRDGELASLDTLLDEGSGWDVDEAVDISSNGQWILARGHKTGSSARHTLLLGLPRPELAVSLRATDVPDSDLVELVLTVENTGDTPVTEIAPIGGAGLRLVPDLFPPANTAELALFSDTGELFPDTLAPGQSLTRTFTFMSTRTGRVLVQAEVTGKSNGSAVRDAEYAELTVDPVDPGVLERMGAIETVSTLAHNLVIDASRKRAAERARKMRQVLPPKTMRQWLGQTGTEIHEIRSLDEGMARMHGISAEEMATAVPRGKVTVKGGKAKIARARRAVARADTKRMEARAEARLVRVTRRQTFTYAESMAFYNQARMETDNNELFKIYDEYVEEQAKSLWQAGGGAWRSLLQLGSYEGRQQLEADLVRFGQLNRESFNDSALFARHPIQSVDEALAVFRDNVEEAEVQRARREQLKRNLYVSNPERALYLKAQDDSRYLADVMRGFIELFDPTPGPVEVLSWAGKQATSKVGRGSVMMAKATEEGDRIAGAKLMHGAEDLGEGVRHADDFLYASADPDELLMLDQIGRKGGAGMRDQRIAEQINREVTEQLRREFRHLDVEFAMSYRPKKDFDPLGSLAKPQAFGEKTLDPRSIQVLGAPPEGLGKLVIFKPDHPLRTKGWNELPAVQKQADLELYKLHLDQWFNFQKRNPAGKTAEWKKAIGEKRTIQFGGGHTVELELEKHKLGKNAFEIRAREMSIDGTLIHKGKPASIGGDLDPLIAVNAKGGRKLEGEVERRALEIWNEKAVKAQKDFGFRSGGHGATAHGDDVTPGQWTKFAKYAAVHLDEAEQLKFEALVVKRAGLPDGTKILPAGIKVNEHLLRTTVSDSYVGPLGQVFD